LATATFFVIEKNDNNPNIHLGRRDS